MEKQKSPRIKVPIIIPYRFYHEITNVVMGEQIGVNPKRKTDYRSSKI